MRTLLKMHTGLMWQDDDFDTIGLDPHCLPLDVAPKEEIVRRIARVFHAWIEDWEDKDVGPKCDPVKEQHILCKYGGLNWIDPDKKFCTLSIWTRHQF